MEIIKKYLEGIVADEVEIGDFLKEHETEIQDFFVTLWKKYRTVQPVESETDETEKIPAQNSEENLLAPYLDDTQENKEIDNDQKQDTVNKFDSGDKPNGEKARENVLTYEIKNKQIIFTNGKVNQKYDVDFDVEKLGIADIAEVSFEKLEEIGLQYFPDEKKIKGTPTKAGDHKIMMYFKRKDWVEGKPQLSREVTFTINPDPKSLWKYFPSEQDPKKTEYPKPDSDKLFVKVEANRDMVAASQRGRSHAIEAKHRDDDFALYFDTETECYVMIVADGAGSAKYSRRGSQIACNTALNVCKEKLQENKDNFLKYTKPEHKNETGKILQQIISNAVFESYKAIENEAQEKNCPVKDYATTLILSVCKKFKYGWFFGAWWVGDGGIGIYRKEPGYLKILGEPDGGEFAGQTRFLTMPDIIKNELYSRICFDIVEDFTALILMTDGITDPKFETDANLNRIEKWHELWEDLKGNNEDGAKVEFTDDNEQADDQLLKWLDFWSKGNHDDRTIAILF